MSDDDETCPWCSCCHEGLCAGTVLAPAVDTRPRVPYVLPNGTIGLIVFDHGQRVPDRVTFAPAGGAPVVEIPLSATYTGPRVLP